MRQSSLFSPFFFARFYLFFFYQFPLPLGQWLFQSLPPNDRMEDVPFFPLFLLFPFVEFSTSDLYSCEGISPADLQPKELVAISPILASPFGGFPR